MALQLFTISEQLDGLTDDDDDDEEFGLVSLMKHMIKINSESGEGVHLSQICCFYSSNPTW